VRRSLLAIGVNVQRPTEHVSTVLGSSSSHAGGFEQAAMAGSRGSQRSTVHGSASSQDVTDTVRSTMAPSPGVLISLSWATPPS
jgi:hypothetical protein